MNFKSVFISDVHLGTNDCQAEKLLDFIKDLECENLFLVGDIIDGWELRRSFRWKQSHSDVIQKLLRKARKGTKVYYILGNHDDFLINFLPISMGEHLSVHREMTYVGVDGKEYLVTHGDMFDAITMTKKWLALIGDKSYLFLLKLNRPLNFVRRKMGLGHWSLSKYMKKNVKKAVSYVCDYEFVLAEYARQKNVHGVICGHIHEPEIKSIGAVKYLNCGDWVESCTAIVEHMDGRFEVYDAHR